jgi:nucleotidyltransferase substrate binding protein (TIGR01987 family)
MGWFCMTEEKIKYKISKLKKALDSLTKILAMEETDIVRDATIQRFEYTSELFWKVFKVMLEAQAKEVATPKQALIGAYQSGWINDEKLWLEIMKDRNISSHVYDEEQINEIYKRIKTYLPEMQRIFEVLSKL